MKCFRTRNIFRAVFRIFSFYCILTSGTLFAQSCPVIPLPSQYEAGPGVFYINANAPIIATDPLVQPTALFFQKEILKTTGLAIPVLPENGLPALEYSAISGLRLFLLPKD